MPISSIEISLGCNNHFSCTFTQLQLGGQLSIWLLNNDAIKRLFFKINSSSSSFSVSHNKQMLLSLLGEKPEIFVEENVFLKIIFINFKFFILGKMCLWTNTY
jgi:hypothetical protein